MRVNISNLGTIKDAQIEIKPLTVFIGENGTGKTWTAYALAGILGAYGYRQHLQTYIESKTEFQHEYIEDSIKQVIENGNVKISVTELIQKYAEYYFNQVAKSANNWMNRFMSTQRVNFDNMRINIELTQKFKQGILEVLKSSQVDAELSIGVKKNSSLLTLNSLKEENSDELYYYMKSESQDKEELPQPIIRKEVKKFLASEIFRLIHRSSFSHTIILPTERTTFISLSFPLMQEEGSEKHKKKKDKIESSNTITPSEPVRHLFSIIVSSLKKSSERKNQEMREPMISKFIELADYLENNILLGDISFEELGSQAELIYTLSKGVNLGLNVSSSMIKELAPLVLYLRYIAEPGDMLIIDEPEMNLHPIAQAEITEFICMLINAGLNVLITTHSPYILDHLSNLIHAKSSDKNEEEIKELFYLEQPTAFISKDDVSAYLFEDDTVKDILTENGDINWGTFSDVSRDISHIYSELIK